MLQAKDFNSIQFKLDKHRQTTNMYREFAKTIQKMNQTEESLSKQHKHQHLPENKTKIKQAEKKNILIGQFRAIPGV